MKISSAESPAAAGIFFQISGAEQTDSKAPPGPRALPLRCTEKGGGSFRRPRPGEDAYQFFVMRKPNRRGSVVKTLVVRPVSSEFRNAPVMAVTLKTFFI
jgi:hypothetical protein